MTRREVLSLPAIPVVAAIVSACSSTTFTEPSTTTPLLEVLQSKGYTVVVEHSLSGGTDLIINGERRKIVIAGVRIGIDPSRSITEADNKPLTFDAAGYPVPDGIEPTFA